MAAKKPAEKRTDKPVKAAASKPASASAVSAGPIKKQMGIVEIVQKYPQVVEVFFKYGMHCLGCAASHFENLDQGCQAHGIDADKMVADMNAILKKSKQPKTL
jgi:hybrid cluster-associated redox disulfide protein